MIVIKQEILNKYQLMNLDEYIMAFGDSPSSLHAYYKEFLKQTDHIPSKILEQLLEELSNASLIDFISIFSKLIIDLKTKYHDILEYRKTIREEVARLEEILRAEV